MNWIILIVAGCFEAGFAFCLGKMKGLSGLEYYLWGAGFLASLSASMLLLAKAVAVGTVLLGITFFHEPATFARLFFISTLIASIIGLKIVS